MKKHITLLAMLVGAVAWGQNEPSVHQEEGRTYVNKSLPMYLQFKTSPNGKAYDLKSEKHPEDADPMYLDTEGVNYIRSHWAVDPETGKPVVPQREVLMEVYADGKAPSTSIALVGAPKYTSGGVVYYGVGLNMELSASDGYAFDGSSVSAKGVSGVKETTYKWQGNSAAYGAPVAMNKEGAQSVTYESVDKVGNMEKSHNSLFTVDLTAPKTTLSKSGDMLGDIYSARASFALSPTDALSGVKYTSYSFDNGSKKYGTAIALSSLSDGNHTFTWNSGDNVKNDEAPQTYSFYLDRIAPVTSIAIQGDKCEGKYIYISERSKFNLTSTDNKAGVAQIEYAIDGGAYQTFSAASTLPNENGPVKVSFRATDKVNNVSAVSSQMYYLDNKAPSTSIKYGAPQFFKQGELYITSNTPITLTATDNASGVVKTTYKIDSGSESTYSSSFTASPEGPRTITFQSTDCVNNVEAMKTSKAHVDNSGPEIYHHFSIEPVGTKTVDGATINVYPNYTRLYLGATDEKVGNDKIEYSLNGEPFGAYSDPRTLDISELDKFTTEKVYEVQVRATDKLGNSTSETFKFAIEK